MAGIGWYRTRADLPGRGGALLTEFDNEATKRQGLTEWGEVSEEKIWRNLEYFFVHLRDVEGTHERFHEMFHDNGPTGLARMLQIYHEAGFDGPIRQDHAPTLNGERMIAPAMLWAARFSRSAT